MEELGQFLKEARLKKGVTIEEASSDTRLIVKYIEAIEAGDISKFKDDLGYLKFFLKAYCEYLGVDYHSIKKQVEDEINTYTLNFTSSSLPRYEDIAQKPQQATRKRSEYNYGKRNKRKKLDFSFMSLIAIITIIVFALLFTFSAYILPMLNEDQKPADPKPPITTVDPDEEKEEEEVKEEETKLEITMVSPTEYEIKNFSLEEPTLVQVNFGSSAWFEARLNGQILAEPKSQIYQVGDQIMYEQVIEPNTQIDIRLGYFANNEILVNDQKIELDPSVAQFNGAQTVKLIFR